MKFRFTAHALERQDKIHSTGMKARYDTETDTLTLVLRSAPVHESDEGNPGVILDYDRGKPCGAEANASKRVEDPSKVEYLADTAAR